MIRRSFLKLLAVAAAAPLAHQLAPVGELLASNANRFQICFPDGSIWTFAGIVTGRDGDELTIKPVGAMAMSVCEPKETSIRGTLVTRDDKTIGELTDIVPPPLRRAEEGPIGVARRGEIAFVLNWL